MTQLIRIHQLDQSVPDAIKHLNSDLSVAIGNFDACHIGHQRLLLWMAEESQRHHTIPCVVFFRPYTKQYFKQTSGRLFGFKEQYALFRYFNVSLMIMIQFNPKIAHASADMFIRWLKSIRTKHVYVGKDYRFGHQRQGSIQDLTQSGLVVHVFKDWLDQAGSKISSSTIRTRLMQHQFDRLIPDLGRPYSTCARVIHGDGSGRRLLQFPTANLWAPHLILEGVFAVKISIHHAFPSDAMLKTIQNHYVGVVHIGPRPTFGRVEKRCEVHILDFDSNHQNLYGRYIHMIYVAYIRPIQSFASLQALKSQINQDIQETRKIMRFERSDD